MAGGWHAGPDEVDPAGDGVGAAGRGAAGDDVGVAGGGATGDGMGAVGGGDEAGTN